MEHSTPDHRPDALDGTAALPEGTEELPRGVRAMAFVRWGLVLAMAVAAIASWSHWALGSAGMDRHAAQYRCPMHPAVVQSHPGECPICGMDLVPVEQAVAAPGAGASAPSAASHAKASAQSGESSAARPGKYWCPMHPEVTSDDPEARCDRCGGMKLVPREAPAAASRAMPGIVPVDLGAERTQLIGVRTAPVVRQRLGERLRTVGFVSADESSLVVVTARATGWIDELRVTQSGQAVRKGQVLATVYSPDLLSAQQVYLNALRWSDRQAAAGPANANQGTLEADARKRLELIGVARDDISEIGRTGQIMNSVPVRSPVAGYVARKAALAGGYLQPGAELFQVVDLSKVWVLAEVPEEELRRVRIGQRARLSLRALPGRTFTGRVEFVYPAVDPETHTLQARVDFRNPGLILKPGMYGDVELEAAAAEVLSVPTEAVIDTGELQYVFVARGAGRFEPRLVRLGSRDDDRVEVLEGVTLGEQVVTTASFLVDSESRLHAAAEAFGK